MDDEYQRFRVKRDDDSDLVFDGGCIATVGDSPDRASANWSGKTGRCTELALYRTMRGKYVCSRINYTQWQGEDDTHEGLHCELLATVIDFFGHGRLAKRLYAAAGLDDIEEVE